MSRYILDTNIIVDIFDDKRKFSNASIGVVKGLLEQGSTLYVNSDTLTTTFYLLRSQRKMTFKEAINAITQAGALAANIRLRQ